MKIEYDWSSGPFPDYAIVKLLNDEFIHWPTPEWPLSEDGYYHNFFEHISNTYNITIRYSSESGIITLIIPDHINTLLELQYS